MLKYEIGMFNIFNKKKKVGSVNSVFMNGDISGSIQNNNSSPAESSARLAEIALNNIHDGVIVTDSVGTVRFINPAAATMIDCKNPSDAIGLDYTLLFKIQNKDGRDLSPEENPLLRAFSSGQSLENYSCLLSPNNDSKRIPISITTFTVDNNAKLITFRNIAKELAEESEQTEFISTASHEMRTPVATIDGYLSLALNPQTATIDERARGYLDAAEKASKHLGKLFQNLLDVTKLDDGRIRPTFVPVEIKSLIRQIVNDHAVNAQQKNLSYSFGATDAESKDHRLEQVLYSSVDIDFMREIMDNLIDNAIKYTPSGGSIYINVLGDGDRVLINVTDTGMGISSEDLQHIFQKFYRADNSDTREIGGTGLGLYLVKQRVEAMGGRVWAESAFGEGTTFYVSLPRITAEEYQKRMIMVENAQMINNTQGGTTI
ncbi:hypothetical protein IKF23_02370 [Candidatus Saccharibacteria bacterium]|nr:hypothetical protein [Candidatus Saccharibacteria bacterium]